MSEEKRKCPFTMNYIYGPYGCLEDNCMAWVRPFTPGVPYNAQPPGYCKLIEK